MSPILPDLIRVVEMTKRSELDLSKFADKYYRWNDNITEDMPLSERLEYLAEEARKCMDLTEHEVGYGILLELLELEPCFGSEYWRMLAECCRSLGDQNSADVADRNALVFE